MSPSAYTDAERRAYAILGGNYGVDIAAAQAQRSSGTIRRWMKEFRVRSRSPENYDDKMRQAFTDVDARLQAMYLPSLAEDYASTVTAIVEQTLGENIPLDDGDTDWCRLENELLAHIAYSLGLAEAHQEAVFAAQEVTAAQHAFLHINSYRETLWGDSSTETPIGQRVRELLKGHAEKAHAQITDMIELMEATIDNVTKDIALFLAQQKAADLYQHLDAEDLMSAIESDTKDRLEPLKLADVAKARWKARRTR